MGPINGIDERKPDPVIGNAVSMIYGLGLTGRIVYL
jgi:hypothetical protein